MPKSFNLTQYQFNKQNHTDVKDVDGESFSVSKETKVPEEPETVEPDIEEEGQDVFSESLNNDDEDNSDDEVQSDDTDGSIDAVSDDTEDEPVAGGVVSNTPSLNLSSKDSSNAVSRQKGSLSGTSGSAKTINDDSADRYGDGDIVHAIESVFNEDDLKDAIIVNPDDIADDDQSGEEPDIAADDGQNIVTNDGQETVTDNRRNDTVNTVEAKPVLKAGSSHSLELSSDRSGRGANKATKVAENQPSSKADKIEVSSIRGVPKSLVNRAQQLFPGANQQDAMAAYIYHFEGCPPDLPVPDKIVQLEKTYTGESYTVRNLQHDIEDELREPMIKISNDIKKMRTQLDELQVATLYNLGDRLGFRPRSSSPPGLMNIRFVEDYVETLLKQLHNQVYVHQQNEAHRQHKSYN